MITWTEAYDVAALARLIASGGPLGGAVLQAVLFTNPLTPGKTLVIGDLTQPTYTGYAAQAVALGAPVRDPQRGIVAVAPGLTWQMTGTPVSTIVYGIGYIDMTGPVLWGVEVFAVPIPLTDDLSFFDSVLEYVQTNDGASFSTIIQ